MALPVLAGVEMGGTKCVCILGSRTGEIQAQRVLPTGEPGATLDAIADVLREWQAQQPLSAIGIACFGPLDLRRDSPGYGRIGATPKPHWAQVDLPHYFRSHFSVPIGLTTDVIGAALAEGRWGAAQQLSDYAYVTVGTGVGVGLVAAGKPLLGSHHPELGHVRIVRAPGDHWPGQCRFHGDCVEGLASGPAIEARCGRKAEQLTADDPVWHHVAHALAQLAHVLVVSTAPQRILFGGGVLSARVPLLQRIRLQLRSSLNGYLEFPELRGDLEHYLVAPGLGVDAGPMGALAVAADAAAATHVA